MTAIRKTTLQVAYFQGFTNLTTDLCTSNDRFGLKWQQKVDCYPKSFVDLNLIAYFAVVLQN